MFTFLLGSLPGRPGDLLDLEQHSVDTAAELHLSASKVPIFHLLDNLKRISALSCDVCWGRGPSPRRSGHEVAHREAVLCCLSGSKRGLSI